MGTCQKEEACWSAANIQAAAKFTSYRVTRCRKRNTVIAVSLNELSQEALVAAEWQQQFAKMKLSLQCVTAHNLLSLLVDGDTRDAKTVSGLSRMRTQVLQLR